MNENKNEHSPHSPMSSATSTSPCPPESRCYLPVECKKRLDTETEPQVRYIWVDKDSNELCWSKSKLIDSKKTKRLVIKGYVTKVDEVDNELILHLNSEKQSTVFVSNVLKKYPKQIILSISNKDHSNEFGQLIRCLI